MKTYIIDPVTGNPKTITAWSAVADPSVAQMLVLAFGGGNTLLLPKYYLPREYHFEDARLAASRFSPLGRVNAGWMQPFHLPSRRECLDLFDARTRGLDDALELIGGDLIARGLYYWTNEFDGNPVTRMANHWLCNLGNGSIVSYGQLESRHLAVPVAKVQMREKVQP